MSVSMTFKETNQVLGMTFPCAVTVTADGAVLKNITVPAAKTGTLTTRTDADTGTLTMAGGHGITTGARLDLYWTGGMRRGITVGTVASNSVPIDLGSGDDLPGTSTAITAMVPVEEPFVVTGDDAQAVACYSDKSGQIVFAESDNSEVKAYAMGGALGSEQSAVWNSTRDSVNPLASGAITKAFFSHSSSTDSAAMRALVLITD